ncbi:MAG: hypothetical protein MJ252_14565 [archaeon]|nr:hypothetical protein [archaeon]
MSGSSLKFNLSDIKRSSITHEEKFHRKDKKMNSAKLDAGPELEETIKKKRSKTYHKERCPLKPRLK